MGLVADRFVFVYFALGGTKQAEHARFYLQFLDEVVAQLEAAPGIEGAMAVNTPPFAGTGDGPARVTAEG
jgi:isocitrate dehydrogenase kinase/phosphatase